MLASLVMLSGSSGAGGLHGKWPKLRGESPCSSMEWLVGYYHLFIGSYFHYLSLLWWFIDLFLNIHVIHYLFFDVFWQSCWSTFFVEEISRPAHHSIAGSFSVLWDSERSTCEPCQTTGTYAGSGGHQQKKMPGGHTSAEHVGLGGVGGTSQWKVLLEINFSFCKIDILSSEMYPTSLKLWWVITLRPSWSKKCAIHLDCRTVWECFQSLQGYQFLTDTSSRTSSARFNSSMPSSSTS